MKTKTLCLVAVIAALLNTAGCSGDDDSVKQADLEKQGTEMKDKSSTVQANDKASMPKELVAEPVTQAEAVEDNAKGEVTMKGSIIYKDLEGGFYAFIAENGDRYTLHGLDETYQKNGLIVEVKGTPKPDMMTFTQFGTVLQVSSVKVIAALLNTAGCSGDDDSVKQADLEKQGTEMKDKSSTVQANDKASMPKELVAEPVTQAEAVEDNAKGEVTMKGSIIYKDLEGGFYAFIAENGDRYTLHGLDETYQKNGLIVEVKGTPKPDMMTFTQFGTVLQVSSVKVLDTSKVIDNLQTQ